MRLRSACLNKTSLMKEPKTYYEYACEHGKISTACYKYRPPTGSSLIFWAALFLLGLATYMICKTIFQDEGQYKAAEKLEDSDTVKENLASMSVILKWSRPFFRRYISPAVKGMRGRKKIKDKYQRKLATAGLTEYMSPEDFFSYKLFLIIGFPVAFVVIRIFMEQQWPFELIPVVSMIGYYYPDIWIREKIKKRQSEVLRAMPFCVDMLALSVEAGLDFVAAMVKVMQKAKPSPLTYEFSVLVKEIAIGASRAEALRNMAWRLDMINMSSFAATLIAADSVGANIAPILKSLADEIRQKRSSEVEKMAAKAGTKILFPTIFLVVPAVIVIVFSPMVVAWIVGGK